MSPSLIIIHNNLGKKALWHANIIEQLGIEGPFVYTDSDVVPDDKCPTDLVSRLSSVLYNYPQVVKTGPALRIDNLPDTYRFKREVLAWENQFWRRPVARGLFLAAIDTTFALYRPHSPFVLEPALRTGWPHVARHEPWYADSDDPSPEQRFYAATAIGSHWACESLPERLETSIRTMGTPQEALLNLGCGHDLIPGWINLDVQDGVGADIIHDLNNCAVEKIPFKNDTIDGFYMCHAFEHIKNTLAMMEELHRVAKPGAKFVIRVPHGGSDNAFEDPTHERPYFPNSFMYFAQPAYSRADYAYLGDWQTERVKLVVDPDLLQSEGAARVLERITTNRNLVSEMIVELTAVKPTRPRLLQLLQSPQPTVSGSRLDEDTWF